MTLSNHLRLQADACRTSASDLAQAEVAELAEAIAVDAEARREWEGILAVDGMLRKAVHNVPVPTGLAARIEALLKASDQQLYRKELLSPPSFPAPAWLVLVAAALLIGAYFWQSANTPALHGEPLVAAALDWRNHEQLVSGTWRNDPQLWRTTFPVPTGYLRRDLAPHAWQSCGSNQFGLSGVVYDLTPRGEQRTYLFVFRTSERVVGMANAPQPWPLRSTGGWSVGAWSDGPFVYVLLAQGEAERFRALVRGGAVAA